MASQLIKFRSSQFITNDPILRKNELGFDMDKRILKIGNGENKWSELQPAISLTLDEGYNGNTELTDGAIDLGDEVVAAVYFQGEPLRELLPGQKVVLTTAGDIMQNDIEVIINKNLDVYIPLWDGSYTSKEGVVSAPYSGDLDRGDM